MTARTKADTPKASHAPGTTRYVADRHQVITRQQVSSDVARERYDAVIVGADSVPLAPR